MHPSALPTRTPRGRWSLLRGIDALLMLALGWVAARITGWHWLTPVYELLALAWIARSLYELEFPKLSTAPVDSLNEEQCDRLLARLRQVQAWIQEFSAVAPAIKPPSVRISLTGFVSYGPIEDDLAIPPPHLLALNDEDLRMAIAHEIGHARRRWVSMRALSFKAKMAEEVAADRQALALTGRTPDDWERSMHAVAQLEGNVLDEQDLEFTVRSQVLRAWFSRHSSVAGRPSEHLCALP